MSEGPSIVRGLATLVRAFAEHAGLRSATPSRAAGMAYSDAQVRLDYLLGLAKPNGPMPTRDAEEVADLLSRGVRHAETATSYCSAIVTKDFRSTHLKDRGYVRSFTRLDFAGPNRYHVLRHVAGRDGDDWDSWVTIGDENYQSVGLWFRTKDRENAEINQRLSLSAFAATLSRMQTVPSSECLFYGQGNERYLLVTYGDVGRRDDSAELDICPRLVSGTCDVHIWLDAGTGAIAKTQTRILGRTADMPIDAEIDGQVDQAFACYGESIRVERPPWLNAVPTEKDGVVTIVDTKIPTVPFYWGSR